MSKMRSSPIFEKHIFPAENAGNMPEKPFFGIFSIFHNQFSLIFCIKMRISNAQNMAEFDFREKIFFRPKMPEICRKSPFLQIFIGYFFLIFRCFFHTNKLVISLFSSLVRSFVHYQVGPISMQLVSSVFLPFILNLELPYIV